MESAPFTVELVVRAYEMDSLGHVNHAVYHQYAEVGRMEMLIAAGFDEHAFAGRRIGPVMLETTMRYRSELHAGQRIAVITTADVGERKVFDMRAELRKEDGTLSAECAGVFGFMDLDARKLEPSPAEVLRTCCSKPELFLS